MDWRAVVRWAALLACAFGAGMLVIWLFTGVWLKVGLGLTAVVFVLALFVVNGWSKHQARRQRGKWESGR